MKSTLALVSAYYAFAVVGIVAVIFAGSPVTFADLLALIR